uniref:Nicastrin n=1 Tax=Caenorhabditis japonica TaxID=281687 RepID=A0A8R1DWH0_CAEJA
MNRSIIRYGVTRRANSNNEHGLVVRIAHSDDFRNLATCYRSTYPTYSGKFWVLLSVDLIRKDTLSLLKSSNCTAGLVLYDPPTRLHPTDERFEASHDSECPNAASDFYTRNGTDSYCQSRVNSRGAIQRDGLMRVDWKLQMVFITNRTDLAVLEKCHSMFNAPKEGELTASYPYCGMSFKLTNMAAGNSEICYRRGKNDAKLFQMNIDTGVALSNVQFAKNLIGKSVRFGSANEPNHHYD